MSEDVFEIYDEGFLGCKRLLKNGKAINEFGMLKELEKAKLKIKELEENASKWISPGDELPNDCEMVHAKTIVRYKRYKPSSQQFKAGIKGRWQEWNGYGWHNMSEPPAEWSRAENN